MLKAKNIILKRDVTHVDYKTQKRTVKRSGQWYADAIGRNGVTDR